MSDRSDRFLRGRRAGKTPMPLRDPAPPVPRSEAAVPPTLRRAGHTALEPPPYRRRSVKPRRRSRGLWSRIQPLLAFALLASLGIGSVGWLVISPRFKVAAVEVQGEIPSLTSWVEGRVQPFVGEPLLILPLSRVTEAVGNHRWIESLEISRVLPDRLSVIVHERQPVALLEVDGTSWVYADGQGRPIAPAAEPGPGAPGVERLTGLLRVRGGWGESRGVPQALGIRRELTHAQPVWGAGVYEVEVLTEEDFRVRTRALSFPILLRAGEVEPKIRWLDRLLPRLVTWWGEPAAVDLRFARRIVMEDVVVHTAVENTAVEHTVVEHTVVEHTSERRPERGA